MAANQRLGSSEPLRFGKGENRERELTSRLAVARGVVSRYRRQQRLMVVRAAAPASSVESREQSLTVLIQAWQQAYAVTRIKLPVPLGHFQQPALGNETIKKGKEYPLHVGLLPQG
jgi:hypothetical protein